MSFEVNILYRYIPHFVKYAEPPSLQIAVSSDSQQPFTTKHLTIYILTDAGCVIRNKNNNLLNSADGVERQRSCSPEFVSQTVWKEIRYAKEIRCSSANSHPNAGVQVYLWMAERQKPVAPRKSNNNNNKFEYVNQVRIIHQFIIFWILLLPFHQRHSISIPASTKHNKYTYKSFENNSTEEKDNGALGRGIEGWFRM